MKIQLGKNCTSIFKIFKKCLTITSITNMHASYFDTLMQTN